VEPLAGVAARSSAANSPFPLIQLGISRESMMSKINRAKNAMRIAVVAAAACGLPALALAQAAGGDNSGNATPSSQGLTEITVTAQKIAQSAQRVPLAITAISAADLESRQISGLNDLKYLVPGLYVEQNFTNLSTPEIFMRGIGQANSTFSFDAPIGIYVDDVYYAKITGAMVDFFDVDRIEVLRGPQGTIYGANSSIGAVRVITKAAPLDTMDAEGEVGFGDNDQRNAKFTMGLPLINDVMGLRISFNSKFDSGWQTNTINGERTDSENSNAARVQLLTKFNDELSLTLRGDFMFDDGRPNQAVDFLTNSLSSLRYQSELFYDTGTAQARNETFGASATLNWNPGDIKVTSISAWRGVNTLSTFDGDGTVEPSFEVPKNDLKDRWATQEVFATGDHVASLPVAWVGGVFMLHEQSLNLNTLEIFSPPPMQHFDQQVNSVAAYMQGTWSVTDKLSLTGGTRYTAEHKDFKVVSYLPDGSFNFAYANDDLQTDKWTWRGAVNYQLDRPVLLYVSVSTGFRQGGLNGQATDLPSITSGAVQPEDTLVYEIGEKSEFFDHTLRINGDFYVGRYNDLQDTVVLTNGSLTGTNLTANVNGVELEARWLPFKGLEFSGSLSTLHDSIQNSSAILADAPLLTWNLAGSYSHELGSYGAGTFGVNFSHTGSSYQDSENTPILEVRAHDNIDAHATLALPDNHWQFTIAGYNLTNKIYSVGGFYIANGLVASTEWPSLPRRWMLSAHYKY
jgi:iron complex outermembrane receptor protein